MANVSVYLVCCNKTAQSAWLINNRHFSLTLLGAEKSKTKVLGDSVFSETQLPGS